ncbi:hypothetical protein K2173_016341 [Erythroxylum novogranatense]|uniref:Uncharacterized protein n=1 Tax=Erythroxylum novogranatense TaxID=1862640 RepID=A0AAV8SGK6_9ROSI|nr:hypothetical protein K2173_016341 [Erythroxylum novogranatense]
MKMLLLPINVLRITNFKKKTSLIFNVGGESIDNRSRSNIIRLRSKCHKAIINTASRIVIKSKSQNTNATRLNLMITITISLLAAWTVSLGTPATTTASVVNDEGAGTLSNIPQTLSAGDDDESNCGSAPADCTGNRKSGVRRIQRPKSRKAESCTSKCVSTCILGGDGSPGEGPLNIRRPLVVFKQGFRSRQYCLVECSDICNLIGDGDDGP